MTDWREVRGDCSPDLVDTATSTTTVYERRNVHTEAVEDMDGTERTQYAYEERTYTKEEYAALTSPATQAIMQAISDVELSVAML